jgi:hypothetical protein
MSRAGHASAVFHRDKGAAPLIAVQAGIHEFWR